jgi:dTDP-4-amino-4,6-dideoxygalactose transaminase
MVFLEKNLYPFYYGHSYIDKNSNKLIKSLVKKDNKKIIKDFENNFSKLIGKGKSASFASGRMAFYSLMKCLDVKKNDEIIILGFTCSVMVNAIIRTGAKTKFSDIDINTLGSDHKSIIKLINKKTKIIVAQHSFGIPCNIFPIKKIAKKNKIFLLEDCALALDSKINKKSVGNFGDAAIFSTDHSKPINTIIGGLIYTNNKKIFNKLLSYQATASELPLNIKIKLYNQFILESLFANPNKYFLLKLINLFNAIKNKLFFKSKIFLEDDYGVENKKRTYPYPSKFPSFLAKIGLLEIKKWKKNCSNRKIFLKKILETLSIKKNISDNIPRAYFDITKEIVPIRFAWHQGNSLIIKKKISSFINVKQFWFDKVIGNAILPLNQYNYIKGSCKLAEKVSSNIINLPCNIPENYHSKFIKMLKNNL